MTGWDKRTLTSEIADARETKKAVQQAAQNMARSKEREERAVQSRFITLLVIGRRSGRGEARARRRPRNRRASRDAPRVRSPAQRSMCRERTAAILKHHEIIYCSVMIAQQ